MGATNYRSEFPHRTENERLRVERASLIDTYLPSRWVTVIISE